IPMKVWYFSCKVIYFIFLAYCIYFSLIVFFFFKTYSFKYIYIYIYIYIYFCKGRPMVYRIIN
ncbi:MAG: hypothetical protein MCS20_01850, partial [Candidatus Phytoplasma mali]|nr:hypothetical protein [Candidatus Phytoplasma australiense]MCG7202133.1 hypothetical protein [Candidatus Phytoplasma mali]MCZ8632654.1 hypothetical protein [Spiroplasma sp. Tabriz.8]